MITLLVIVDGVKGKCIAIIYIHGIYTLFEEIELEAEGDGLIDKPGSSYDIFGLAPTKTKQ
jgi:hypothetical protein